MTFGEKLRKLRMEKGMTQEELAEVLYVSRTAVSKWESGRGFPNIESLKAISKKFSVTVDVLLSGDELMTLAEEEQRQKEMNLRDLLFGLLDCSMALLLVLPFFGQRIGEYVHAVSLFALSEIRPYLKTLYFIIVIVSILWGLLTLLLQNCRLPLWVRCKSVFSLLIGAVGTAIFIISQQTYAAVFVFVFMIIKVLIKRK